MPQLFISHKTEDDAHVNRLADLLEQAGFTVWVDHRNGITPNDANWDKAIRTAIAASDFGLLLMSDKALQSDICQAECLLVRELRKPLYVARLEAVNAESVWLYIKMIQYADLVSDFEAGTQSLIRALGGDNATDLPEAVHATVTGGDTMRLYLPYLKNPLRGRTSDIELIQSDLGDHVLQVVGTGGVGKSRLCAEIARTYPHGAIWHRCQTGDQGGELLPLLLSHFGLPADAHLEVVLQKLSNATPLLVIDNAEDIAPETDARKAYVMILQQLIGRGMSVLLTTRTPWADLKPRRQYTPTTLVSEVATQLTRDFAHAENITLTETQAATLAQAARLHPRLIEFAVGQLHERRLERIIRQLEELTHDDVKAALDEMLTKSVHQMAEQATNGQASATLLKRLTILQDTFALEAIQALAPDALSDSNDLEDAVETLQRWQFVRRNDTRYSLGDLVREALGIPADTDVFGKYADHYIEIAKQFDTRPPEEWHNTVELDTPNIVWLGEELTRRATHNPQDATLAGTMGDFAYAVTRYVFLRPQAIVTERGTVLRGLNWLEAGLVAFRQQGNQRREALMLNQIALVWSDLGEPRKALVFHEQALPLYRAVGDSGGEAATLSNIGAVWQDLGEPRKALDYFEQALPLDRKLGDRGGEAAALSNIGLVWHGLGEPHKALEFYEQSLPLDRKLGDRGGEATTLSNIGLVWHGLGEPHKALEFYEQALLIHREVGNRTMEATTLNNIGEVWRALGEPRKALEYYEQALLLMRAVGNRGGEANTLNNIGLVWHGLGEPHKALEYYEQALLLRRAVGDRGGEATTLNNIGGVWDALGEPRKALEYYEQALPLRRAMGDRGGEARTLNGIGAVWSALGESRKALDFYEQALPLYRAVGDRRGEATTLSNIGLAWHGLGEPHKALDFYEQALPLRRAVGDRGGEAVTCFNIGMIYRSLGDLDKAIEYVERCVQLDLEVEHPDLESDRRTLEQLKRQRDGGGQASPQDEAAQVMQMLMQFYQQQGADAVRQMLTGKVDDAVIEAMLARLAGGG